MSDKDDCISRQAALDEISEHGTIWMSYTDDMSACEIAMEAISNAKDTMIRIIKGLPTVQPERTCVNCGRTANNGGWYADGGTRCPIEEHYALPKDGYCHLWEKRNVTDDDYPEGRADE